MVQNKRWRSKHARQRQQTDSLARSVFGPMTDAGAASYLRSRDLPKLIALWPRELADNSPEGFRYILAKLRSALRAERRRGLAGHWSYDLNRHMGLISAYKAELASLSQSAAQPNCTRRAKGLG